MAGSAVYLPRGGYYALTWGIPDNYGGMTSTLLHRSRAFKRLGGVDVEVLTVDDRPDYAELSSRLLASGELIEGVSIRNLWDDLRSGSIAPGEQQHAHVEPPPLLEPHADDRVVAYEGAVLLRERRSTQGVVGGIDRFRRDGTLLSTERGEDGARTLLLYDESGRPVRSWSSRWKLYRWWLDRVFKKRLSFLLVDSKTAARFVPGYRRENVVTVHIVHASHRDDPELPSLRPSRESVLKRSSDFDAVVVLTERQRAELLEDLSVLGVDAGGRLRVIPNGIELPQAEMSGHSRGHGIVVASLDERKRVERAVDAVVAAHAQEPGIVLDIYGDGVSAREVDESVKRQHAEGFVTLHGYQPDARSRFKQADFSLLTSSSEGLPLVLVESMAVGCIPIAYDIRYGPADIIRDGVDGFLVPDGDTKRMAERIVELQRMPEAQLRSMRSRAIARSREFSDEAIVRRWGRELERALNAKRFRDARDHPLLERLRRRAGALRRRMRRVLAR